MLQRITTAYMKGCVSAIIMFEVYCMIYPTLDGHIAIIVYVVRCVLML